MLRTSGLTTLTRAEPNDSALSDRGCPTDSPTPIHMTLSPQYDWSNIKGQTIWGTPHLRAIPTVPLPPWCTTDWHSGKSLECGTYSMRQWMLQFWKFLHNISHVLRRLELGDSCKSAFFPHWTRPEKQTNEKKDDYIKLLKSIHDPLTPTSDQDRIFPNNIYTKSSRQVIRIEKISMKKLLVDPLPNSPK